MTTAIRDPEKRAPVSMFCPSSPFIGLLSCAVIYVIAINFTLFDKCAYADETDPYLVDAQRYLQDLGDKSIALLSDESKSFEDKKAEVESILNAEVDFELVSKFVLGKYWKSVLPGQRSEYFTLFRELEIDTLSRRLLKYPVKSFEIVGAELQGHQNVLVHTMIYRVDAEPFLSAWRLWRSNYDIKIIDLEYDGISLAKTRREEFANILKDRGFDGLMDQLKQNLSQLR